MFDKNPLFSSCDESFGLLPKNLLKKEGVSGRGGTGAGVGFGGGTGGGTGGAAGNERKDSDGFVCGCATVASVAPGTGPVAPVFAAVVAVVVAPVVAPGAPIAGGTAARRSPPDLLRNLRFLVFGMLLNVLIIFI